MLPGRRVSARALAWRATGINFSQQVRFLASSKSLPLPKSIANASRINAILKVQKAVAATSSRLTLDSLTTDDQRRDYLWSRKQQLLRILPGREWRKVFAIARRLFEFDLLARPPSDKEFRKRMLENSGDLLIKLEQTPMWLTAEMDLLEGIDAPTDPKSSKITDTGKQEPSTESNVAEKNTPVEDTVVTGEPPEQKSLEDKKASSKIKITGLDQVSITPDVRLPEEKQEGEDVSRYRNIIISPESESTKPTATPSENPVEKSADKPIEKSIEKSAEQFLEKKATESTKEAIQIVFPEYEKIIKPTGREEESTVERLSLLQTPEDVTPPSFAILQKLSRTLTVEGVRPDLKPVFLPNQAAYALLAEATTLLEEACYEFIKKRAPSVTTWPTFDCPEAQEYKKWVDLIVKLGKEHSKDGFKLPPKFAEGVSYGDIIRNSAAHRLPIHAPKLRILLNRARVWVDSLDVPEISEKFARLEQSAADMQTDLEGSLSPVVDEIRVVLSRIKGRWEEVKRLENKILEIQKDIRREKSSIEVEERNMQDTLRKAQVVRYDQGQKFERDAFRQYVQGAHVNLGGSEVETEGIIDEWPEDENVIEELPVETELDSSGTKSLGAKPSQSDSKVTEKGKTSKIILSPKEVEDILATEESLFTETDRTQLARDSQGGLVTFKTDTLADIEELPSPGSRSSKKSKVITEGKKEKTDGKTLETGTATKKGELLKGAATRDEAVPNEKRGLDTRPDASKKSKEIKFEGANLSRDSDINSLKDSTTKWYNPLSWFR
ncbi:hypothetical protein TWF730_007290 [Orbilia blumenaviensis]|uniref:Uncharacterized protein n=1 Tax=Orbilia blumenaviensis TaxID=1796055 RepID=A0AAV9V9N5_9PEZI